MVDYHRSSAAPSSAARHCCSYRENGHRRRRSSGRGVATGSVIGLSARGRDCWPSHGSDGNDRGSAAGLSSGGRRPSSSAVRAIAISAEGGTSSIAIPRTQPMRTVPLRRATTASSSVTGSSPPSCCCACRRGTGSVMRSGSCRPLVVQPVKHRCDVRPLPLRIDLVSEPVGRGEAAEVDQSGGEGEQGSQGAFCPVVAQAEALVAQ
jgi:hypothetical protein